MHDNQTDPDEQPWLTDDEAREVVALVQTALGGTVSPQCQVEDLEPMVETLGHPVGMAALWLADAPIGVSLCPACAAVTISVMGTNIDYLHGAVQLVECVRRQDIGGDPDEMVTAYKRVPATNGVDLGYVYVMNATYWLDTDTDDKVIRAVRSLVTVLDEITRLLTAAAQAASMRQQEED